jgi:hypothetical protein
VHSRPETRHATSGDVTIAYQAAADGPVALTCAERGEHQLRGTGGRWKLFAAPV